MLGAKWVGPFQTTYSYKSVGLDRPFNTQASHDNSALIYGPNKQ